MTEIDYKIKEVIKSFGYHIAFWCSNYKYDTILIFKENKEIKIRLDTKEQEIAKEIERVKKLLEEEQNKRLSNKDSVNNET